MNKETKTDWLKRAKEHQKADRFIQGEWLNGMVGDFKSGCFFGCMTQSDDNTLELAAKQMDLPLWLVIVAEKIFEGLPQKNAVKFPVQFIKAITTDKNYDQAYKDWHYNLLMNEDHGQINFAGENKEVRKAIIQCAELFKMEVITESAAWSAARSAWSAWSAWSARSARSAARSARSAAESAWSVARSAAESAAWSAARSARSAAESAAESAARSAWSAAEESYYQWMRDELIKLI